MSFLEIKNITAGYGKRDVISDVSFCAEAGTVTGILGANGSGKTTLLKAMCNIIPHKGSCMLENTELNTLSARQISKLCSYIPQRSGISIDISVIDTVLMGFNPQLGILQQPDRSMRDTAEEMLNLVGLGGRNEDNYLTLSEGQKQLCIMARTLVNGSRLLLMDEPESALDFCYRYRIMEVLQKYIHGKNRAAVAALHDPQLALRICDRLLVIDGGKLIDILRPKTDPSDKMEEVLSQIYGKISLVSCRGKSGSEHIIMLKEDDL